jgi:hypothetical protein
MTKADEGWVAMGGVALQKFTLIMRSLVRRLSYLSKEKL